MLYAPPAQVGSIIALAPDDGRTPCVRPSPTAFWSQDKKWASLEPSFAADLRLLIRILAEDYGWEVEIDNAWRPWSTQPAYQKSAGSKTPVSLHNHVTPSLLPAAYAADLRVVASVHGTLSAEEQDDFFRDLREAADAVGLRCGGWYGVSDDAHTREATVGWDPPHVEVAHNPYKYLSTLGRVLAGRYAARGVATPASAPSAAGIFSELGLGLLGLGG